MKIIKNGEIRTEVSYSHNFEWVDSPGAGFSFPCDAKGKVALKHAAAAENYRKCRDGSFAVRDLGVRREEHSYRVPAIGLCNRCRNRVELSAFTNTCGRCGTDYNWSGAELAPRHHWGEETGEHWSDIARI